jgi:ribosomal protein S18 acetylase RimI-like enzyme
MAELKIRPAIWLDNTTLYDIDLKCFDQPWEASYWVQWFVDTRAVLIVEVDGKPAGFVAGELNQDGFCIEKICVKPGYRRLGVSRMLLNGCEDLATQCEDGSKVHLAIPEPWLYDCFDCVVEWIRAVGFKARLPYLKDYFTINGDTMDGVRCELEDT